MIDESFFAVFCQFLIEIVKINPWGGRGDRSTLSGIIGASCGGDLRAAKVTRHADDKGIDRRGKSTRP